MIKLRTASRRSRRFSSNGLIPQAFVLPPGLFSFDVLDEFVYRYFGRWYRRQSEVLETKQRNKINGNYCWQHDYYFTSQNKPPSLRKIIGTP